MCQHNTDRSLIEGGDPSESWTVNDILRQLMQPCGLDEQIKPEVWQRAWIVNCQAVGDGRQSLRYLAPYVFRV